MTHQAARRTPAIGLVTSVDLPQLTADDQCLLEKLTRSGIHAVPVVWTDASIRWTDFDLLMLRSCWDYHRRPRPFLNWLGALRSAGVDLVNPLEVLEWNIHKGYLGHLAALGIKVADTVSVKRGSGRTLSSILDGQGWTRAVVKPAIAASACGAWRVERDTISQDRFRSDNDLMDLLVQRFVPEVTSHGEWSLVFLGGAFSHAVLKRSAAGDFRVQSEFGGSVVARRPDDALVAWATDATSHIPGSWMYCRVDAVETSVGYLLMELECIEPELFFRFCGTAPPRVARLLLDRISVREGRARA